jgi:hypothetical protein
MKKGLSLILLFGLIIFSAANVCATITVPLKCSNALPDGNDYATVTIQLLPEACSGYDGVKITVQANESVLIPTETDPMTQNYGIQRFGFNYNGNPTSLEITSYEDDGITVENQWKVKYSQNVSEFGVFAELLQGTGKHRHNPFIITICKPGTDLTEAAFNVENSLGNNFVAHIADFYYNDVYYETDSAYFADCPETTEISLSSFTAKAGNNLAKLKWVTESEIDNSGFNIWRADAADGEYVKLNDEIIPAKGSGTNGATYVFTDKTAKNRNIYFYKLQDIDVYGTSTFHGPVSATPRLIMGILGK